MMKEPVVKIFPIGDSAVTVEFGTGISIELNEKAIKLARHFEQHPFPGLIESVSAYSSTTFIYDVVTVRSAFPQFETAYNAASDLVNRALASSAEESTLESRTFEIPVSFAEPDAIDLNELCEAKGLSREKVIEIFLSREYRVFMIGFLPGFPYLGEVDERIATPRRKTPRLKVPKGSVGIAGTQTGIYPLESPGGWQIVGRTDFQLFDPLAEFPCPLRAGDKVIFIAK